MMAQETLFGLPLVTLSDVEALTHTGINDDVMLDLRTSNPVLYSVITQGLERIAPQDPALKARVRDFLGNVLRVSEATSLRTQLELSHPDIAGGELDAMPSST